MDYTIDYYNTNAENFIVNTQNVDMHLAHDQFLQLLPERAHILDFGCGSGRDTKYFLEKGHQLTATDGSAEMCRLASDFTGIEVKEMLFRELDDIDTYDGIWACSSILHLPKAELYSVFLKMCVALKDHGIIYTSFKYGDYEGKRNGRHFTDFTYDAFLGFMKNIPELIIEDYWITSDVRPGRGDEKWLNLLLRKSDMENLPLSAKKILKGAKEGKAVTEELEKATQDPMTAQEAFLLQWIEKNKDTEYGRKYHFDEIHSIEDYQKQIPVTGYDDYAPYIRREAEGCEAHLLCAEEMLCYAKTSGTVGVPKHIPTTIYHKTATGRYNVAYQYALVSKTIGTDWMMGHPWSIIECPSEVPVMKNGLCHCAVSAIGLMQARKSPYMGQLFVSPEEAIFSRATTNTRYLHIRFALQDPEITSITATMSSFLLNIFRFLEKNWEIIVKDIEEGTIDESIKMDDDVREGLQKKLKPMPERAARLRAIFEQGFDEPVVRKIWPRIAYSAGVGTASFAPYQEKLKRYLGDLPHYYFGIGASEGFYSVPYKLNEPDSVFIPDINFYEFIPEEADGDPAQALTLDQVEVGKEYELIVTNLSGFYRYRMRDIVKITGMYHNTPTAQFIRRIDKTVSLTGEKTTETALREAAYQTAAGCGFSLVDFSVYPDDQSDPVGYIFYVETENMPADLTESQVQTVLNENLAKANPSLGDKISRGTVAPAKVLYLNPETYLLYQEMMFLKGANRSQLKPVTVISNEFQRRFFAKLSAEKYEESM